MNTLSYKFFKYAGWAYILLSILILMFFAWVRVSEIIQPPGNPDAYQIRYVTSPTIALLHMIPGLIFLVLAPLQFIKKIRSKNLGFHRWMGRFLLISGIISGITGVLSAFILPAFGGLGTQAATVFFGIIFTFALCRAFYQIRRKKMALHREWMIRAFSLAAGVATIRIFVGLLQVFTGIDLETVFPVAFWLGFSINLLIAEIWINYTRPARPA